MSKRRVYYTRPGRALDPKVQELFPTYSGGVHRSDRTKERAAAEDREPRAIRCFQCGQPVEDYSAYVECPFCGSDNMLGKLF